MWCAFEVQLGFDILHFFFNWFYMENHLQIEVFKFLATKESNACVDS